MKVKLPDWMLAHPEGDGKGDKGDGKQEQTAHQSVTPTVITPSYHPTTVAAAGQTDYNKALDDACEHGHQAGADFWAFHKTLAELDGQPMLDEQKYKVAFTAFKTQGVTPAKLAESGNYYIGLLNNEANDFNKGHDAVQKRDVTDKKAQVDLLTQQNADMAKKQQENLATIQKLNSEIISSTTSLSNEKAAFDAAVQNKTALFNDTISKIKQFLYATTK